jgi:hypothetical protein
MNDTNENLNQECEVIGSTETRNSSVRLTDIIQEKLVGIYGLQNKLKPDKWYVGQSIDMYDRWNGYRLLDCKKQPKLYNALLKYGYENFEKVVIEKCEEIPWIMDYREMYWIRNLDCINNGYNCTEGGIGGRKSDETRKKMSESRMGIVYSEKTKKKMSVSQSTPEKIDFIKNVAKRRLGVPLSVEHKKKLSIVSLGEKNHFYGKTHSEEAKHKISEKAKLRNVTKNNNPFFGRTHSSASLKIMSEKAKIREMLKKLKVEPVGV